MSADTSILLVTIIGISLILIIIIKGLKVSKKQSSALDKYDMVIEDQKEATKTLKEIAITLKNIEDKLSK